MVTTMGTIVIELDADAAPITVQNFLRYIVEGFYDGRDGLGKTTIHRVIPGFVIQGGGFDTEMIRKTTHEPIINEADNGLHNFRGTLAMARFLEIDSATTQFFINLGDNGALDHRDLTPRGFGYAVFGQVVEGMAVVDSIAVVETTSISPYSDVPVVPILISAVSIHATR
jgi:cyclophilin family peptidyl-prolyl cis-trans isomerase